MDKTERKCRNCKFYEWEHAYMTYICGDPDGEYLGEPMRPIDHCPDFEAKEGKSDKDGNTAGG